MTHNYTDEVMHIFKRLVAAKRSGSLMESGWVLNALRDLADIEADRQEKAEAKQERF